ncbi:MAG TPA: aldose 1-epimerase [Solirubrobacteraceae bacterium]|nr:aldose 1-epimerase [Solirubrobacteraceae bacterium]
MAYEITITDPDGTLEASFVPEVGMIGCSLRHEGEELLFPGDGLAAYREHGSTFALPLLHPWANRVGAWDFPLRGERVRLDPESPITHRDAATGTAIHGLLAASPYWTVTDADRSALTAELDFGRVPEYVAAFPFPHAVRYHAWIERATLTVAVAVRATAEVEVPIAFGFHPYLTLPGSDRRDWEIELPVARRALTDERMLPIGETVPIAPGELDGPLGERTFDTGYPELHGERPAFSVADGRRRLTLRHLSGYPVSQVYAPEASRFICFEPMTAPVDALISGDGLRWVAPGQEFEASFSITVDSP